MSERADPVGRAPVGGPASGGAEDAPRCIGPVSLRHHVECTCSPSAWRPRSPRGTCRRDRWPPNTCVASPGSQQQGRQRG